jgi:hypothetical protein
MLLGAERGPSRQVRNHANRLLFWFSLSTATHTLTHTLTIVVQTCVDMSDFEDDCDDDSYEYPSEDEDEDEAGVAADWQRNVRVKESHSATAPLTHSLSPWMDADEQDFRLWGDGNALRMSIFSSLRQIVNSGGKAPLFTHSPYTHSLTHSLTHFTLPISHTLPRIHPFVNTLSFIRTYSRIYSLTRVGARKRVLCSRDELFGEGDVKTMRIFLEVAEVEAMTVVYTLSFNATKAMSMCPPLLKCISYCGRGTYLFPNLLLPNCLGQFVDFGKVFNTLATELAQYKPSFSSFVMVNEESPYYMVQELAYLTQYRTSFVFEVTDSGIVTGVERDRKVNPGDGIGYSSRSRAEVTNVQKDDSNQYQLTTIMVQIDKIFNEKLLDSPLPELLAGMITELSVEEITRSAPYASSIFKLVAALQAVYAKRGIGGFDTNTLYKLAIFKDILMDEYGLDSITLPETIVAGLRNSSPHKQEHAKESQCGGDTAMELDDETDDDPVIFVDGLFTRHSYLSDVTTTGKAILKRMKIEFHTLSTTLPPSIRYMVSEENFSLGKFMIVGPVDTPYEGGFFLFGK